MDFKKMNIDDIIAWCKANGQIAWLKEIAATKVACEVYPKVEKDGKKVADKSQKPTIEYRPITFIKLKTEFVNNFMPEIAPKAKAKEPTMFDKIAAL